MTEKLSKDHGPKQGVACSAAMARLALLADPTFLESWEIHRWGFLGEPVLSSVIFPAGIVLEPLLKHGHRDPKIVEGLFRKWEETDYHYFTERCGLPPDIDLLGLMLRLHRYRLKTIDPAQSFRIPLRRLEVNSLPTGEIPVWLMNPAENDGRSYTKMAGNRCDTCLANLLIGLWGHPEAADKGLVRDGTLFLLKRLLKREGFHSEYYSPLTGLWRLTEFAHLVQVQGPTPLREMAVQAVSLLRERFDEHRYQIETPLRTGVAVLTSLHEGMQDLFKEEWVESIINRQRFDGLWEAEPFYGVPTIGETLGWHSSRLITTAICYDALMTYLTWRYK